MRRSTGENVHLVFGNCRVYVSTEEVSYHLWPYLRPHSVFADLRQGFQPEAQFVGGTTARRRPCAPQHGVASRCLVHGKHGPAEVGLTWLRGLQDVGSTGAWSQCRCCGRGWQASRQGLWEAAHESWLLLDDRRDGSAFGPLERLPIKHYQTTYRNHQKDRKVMKRHDMSWNVIFTLLLDISPIFRYFWSLPMLRNLRKVAEDRAAMLGVVTGEVPMLQKRQPFGDLMGGIFINIIEWI